MKKLAYVTHDPVNESFVAGRLECTCGDYEFRRSAQSGRDLCDCKHCVAIKRHFVMPEEQRPDLVSPEQTPEYAEVMRRNTEMIEFDGP